MPTLEYLRSEIEHMRRQIGRQQKEIQSLRRAGIATSSADALLERMQSKVDNLHAERDRMIGEQRLNARIYASGKRINGTSPNRRT